MGPGDLSHGLNLPLTRAPSLNQLTFMGFSTFSWSKSLNSLQAMRNSMVSSQQRKLLNQTGLSAGSALTSYVTVTWGK